MHFTTLPVSQRNLPALLHSPDPHQANLGGDGNCVLVRGAQRAILGEAPLSGKMLCQIYLPVAFRSIILSSGEIVAVNQV